MKCSRSYTNFRPHNEWAIVCEGGWTKKKVTEKAKEKRVNEGWGGKEYRKGKKVSLEKRLSQSAEVGRGCVERKKEQERDDKKKERKTETNMRVKRKD